MYYPEISRRLNNAISNTLPSIDAEIRQYMVNGIIEELDKHSPKTKEVIARSGDKYYVIKDSDLDILESLLPLIPPALIAHLTSPDVAMNVVSSLISVIAALTILLLRFRKNRILLGGRGGLVLLKIKENPGISRDELSELTSGIAPSRHELNEIIDSLKTALKSDGTRVALITEDRNHQLYAADV